MNYKPWLIGGGLVAAAVTAAYVGIKPAAAADLGGNCCADLEERIADLEASVARKGNRKVTLTISGHVSKALMWWRPSGEPTEFAIVDNPNTNSRFRFEGEGKISPGVMAGYRMEFGVGDGGQVMIRHNAMYLKSTTLGTVWVGHTSTATDAIVEIDISNSNVAALSFLSAVGPQSDFVGGFDGGRSTVVKYITPSVAGFTAEVAINQDNVWDAALRFANEFGPVRLAAGVGYAKIADDDRISGSASAMHAPTGVFLTGAYGQLKPETFTNGFSAALLDAKIKGWMVKPGIERNWFGIGKTTLFAEYADVHLDAGAIDGKLTSWGGGVVQSIDAAALDLFAAVRHMEAKSGPTKLGEGDYIIAGTKISF